MTVFVQNNLLRNNSCFISIPACNISPTGRMVCIPAINFNDMDHCQRTMQLVQCSACPVASWECVWGQTSVPVCLKVFPQLKFQWGSMIDTSMRDYGSCLQRHCAPTQVLLKMHILSSCKCIVTLKILEMHLLPMIWDELSRYTVSFKKNVEALNLDIMQLQFGLFFGSFLLDMFKTTNLNLKDSLNNYAFKFTWCVS